MADPIGGIKADSADVLRALDRLAMAGRASSSGGPCGTLGNYMLGETHERFETETDPEGRPWPITWRKRRRPSAKILTNTGRLKRSFRRRVNQSAGTVEVFSSLRYAYIQHYGAKNLRNRHRRIPRGSTAEEKKQIRRQRAIDKNVVAARKPIVLQPRPILGVDSGDERALLDIIRRRALRLWR